MNNDKRLRIVEASDRLVQELGFHRTTLANVAAASGVPLGNLYYYFRTKEALGAALIDYREARYRALREQWQDLPDARSRLHAFVQMTADNRAALARGGCPIGSLCQELHKEGGPLAEQAAAMFRAQLQWLTQQFQLLGKAHEAHGLALHVLSALEGASLLTHTFHQPDLMLTETTRLHEWIEQL